MNRPDRARWAQTLLIPVLTSAIVVGGGWSSVAEQGRRLERMEDLLEGLRAALANSENSTGRLEEQLQASGRQYEELRADVSTLLAAQTGNVATAADLRSLAREVENLTRLVEDNRIRLEKSQVVIEGLRMSGRIP